MLGKICFFAGNKDSFNVQLDLNSIGETINRSFDLDVISTYDFQFRNIRGYYNTFGTNYSRTQLGGYKALDAYLRESNPDCLVNISEPPIHGNIAGFLAQKHGVSFIYRYSGDRFDIHNIANNISQRAKWFLLNNVVGNLPLKLAAKYITLGPVGKTRLTTRGVPASDISVLPPPVLPSRFKNSSTKTDCHIPGDRNIVLFVGRRSRLKGIDILEKAIPEILQRRNDLQFVFVGSGRDINVPKTVSDHITVVGPVSPESVPAYFHRADVLVHPSLTESFGRVLVEALFCNTPVVARNAGEMPTITDNLFTTMSELVDLIVSFETLPLDDPDRYSPEALRPAYTEFFEQFN